MQIAQIVEAIEEYAPPALQEGYDNTGLIIGDSSEECTGVLLTVDVTPAVVDEAICSGCNMILAHHPLIFSGIKRLNGSTSQQKAIIAAVRNGIAVYACHTSLDRTHGGVSQRMARMLGLKNVKPLEKRCVSTDGNPLMVGLGAVGETAEPMTKRDLINKVKKAFGSPIARCSAADPETIVSHVALCGGSGGSMIDDAIGAGAQVYVTSDVKYHDFVDYADRITIVDIGHHESENCAKKIFYDIISEKFPNFAIRYSQSDVNPINYL